MRRHTKKGWLYASRAQRWQVTHIELAGETRKAGLAINRGQYMEGELLGSFNDDVVARRVPPYHMMVFGLFKQTE